MRRTHTARTALTALGVALVVSLGAPTAGAAQITGSFGTGGTSGELSNGVGWTATRALGDGGAFSLTTLQTNTVTFDRPVLSVDVAVSGLVAAGTGLECVVLPVGTVVVDLNRYAYEASTRTVCGTAARPNVAAPATFRVTGVTSVTFTGSGGSTSNQWSRQIVLGDVVVDRASAVLVDDAASTVVGAPAEIDVLGNDELPDGSTGFVLDTTSAQGGTVVDNGDGTVTYTPATGFVGTDTFAYRVTGPDGVEVSATVTVTVTEDAPPPVPMAAGGFAAAGLACAGLGFSAVRAADRAAPPRRARPAAS
ncbi:MAG: Ig-like domain-containing protein [Cellulosimicrobium cellulans]